jgi:hypothetical protein
MRNFGLCNYFMVLDIVTSGPIPSAQSITCAIKPPEVEVALFGTTRLHPLMAVDYILGTQDLARVRADQ